MIDRMRIENMSIGYKGNVLVKNISTDLRSGVTAIIGRNGAGKSTLIKTLTGNIRPLAGDAFINNLSIQSIAKKDLAKIMALVTSDTKTAGGLKLKELVALGRIPFTGYMGILPREDKDKIEDAMIRVGIVHKKDSFVSELSDGERQRGLIAKGLVQDTPIIIMDEPFSYLDVASRLEMYYLTKQLAEEKGKAILYSTHEMVEAINYVDNFWVITKEGFESGTKKEILENDTLNRIFPNERVKYIKETGTFNFI